MCDPTLIGIAVGVGQTAATRSEQMRQHRAQVDAVNRSNAMARQKYQNDIQISAYNDQRKLDVFEAQLAADSASQANFHKQQDINAIEASRAVNAADQELNEKITEAMFESQANLAASIQAQGTVLAGMQSGQSMMLELQQAERELGFESAQIDATVFDATKSYGIKRFGIDLDQWAADNQAVNSITNSALFAPTASFQTIKPIKQNAPSKPSMLGAIMSGVGAGLGAYKVSGGTGFAPKTKVTG
tara:strand:- start:5915 stop:6649 length:735 start_codon:yes stop_codon:yes gene_type:complete